MLHDVVTVGSSHKNAVQCPNDYGLESGLIASVSEVNRGTR